MNRALRPVFVLVMLSGCATPDLDPQVDADLPIEGETQELSLTTPRVIEHGSLTFGSEVFAELTSHASAHAFDFALPVPARVELETRATGPGAVTDTLLELYRQTARGLRLIARNDDKAGSVLAALAGELSAGDYRVIVRGGSRNARGPFMLAARCEGNGCLPLPSPCLFGSQFSDIRSNPALQITSETWVRAVSELDSELQRQQLVLAVQQSSHTDVTTPEEALARVDQQEARRIQLDELSSGRTFSVFEYGAGDNSYGAFFASGTLTVVASIHDGDLIRCSVFAP